MHRLGCRLFTCTAQRTCIPLPAQLLCCTHGHGLTLLCTCPSFACALYPQASAAAAQASLTASERKLSEATAKLEAVEKELAALKAAVQVGASALVGIWRAAVLGGVRAGGSVPLHAACHL